MAKVWLFAPVPAILRIMKRKIFISVSLLFSALVIVFGGYNCARQHETTFGGLPGTGYPPQRPPGDPTPPGDPLPPEPEDDRCNRNFWREKTKDFGGASAYVRTSRSNFQDFNLGQPLNFSVNCTRMILNMERIRGQSVFKGDLYITYEEGDRPVGKVYESGDSEKDNRNNRWSGSWRADRNGRTSAKFNAIFEQTKKYNDMALILQIERVEEVDIGDGVVILHGAGSIWFKMFRSAINIINNRGDVCLRNSGGYLRFAQNKPPRPNHKCWFVPLGAYNCWPNGVDTSNPRVRYSERSIDISGDLPCYDKFGSFERLDINKAFNVHEGDHP